MQIAIALILMFVCVFAPVIGYALYRYYGIIQLRQFLEMSKPPELIDKRMIMAGYTAQEVADGLCMMVNAKPSMSDYQPEQCSFTQYNDDGFAFLMPVEEAK